MRVEQVEVVRVEDGPKLKAVALKVTGSDDASRLGVEVSVPAPRSMPVRVGELGSALWLPGEELPKLILGGPSWPKK